jgi:hypothetical protein
MTSNGTLTKSIQNEQLMQLLDKQDKTLYINGRQVLDVRTIVGKLVETMNLGIDGILSEEEAEKLRRNLMKFKLNNSKNYKQLNSLKVESKLLLL